MEWTSLGNHEPEYHKKKKETLVWTDTSVIEDLS
jgi:hypothetical protein